MEPNTNEHHEHSHGKVTALTKISNAFIIGIVLNLVYVTIQIIMGLKINSLSVLSDAGHNFLDVGGLALSLLAFKLTKSKATDKYTYGFKKSSILISLLNAVVLLISIGAIGYEALLRCNNPQPVPGCTVAIIAGIGIFINGFSAFLFFKYKDKDSNIKSAFLHLTSDAIVSLGLVVGGIVIYFTHLYWIDSLLSLLICLVILASTWRLLKDSLHLSLDGIPDSIDLEKIKKIAKNIKGVNDLHHIHIWAMSTMQNALTAHLSVSKKATNEEINKIKHELKHELKHQNIQHCTIEIETENCEDKNC